jgi:hypothetical protein
MKAFYFAANDKKLRFGDNRKISVGTTHKVDCNPILCECGLHASKRLIDALKYSPGHWLYLVELSGEIVEGGDKVAATARKYLARFNAEKLLREFARKQALINIDKVKPYCSDSEYLLILDWLTTGAKELRVAAWSAAVSAANAAAWSAAVSASRPAAWSAASRAAAVAAAKAAAEAASRSATWSAAEAAWSAAMPVAWSTAANTMLTDMVRDATGWEI